MPSRSVSSSAQHGMFSALNGSPWWIKALYVFGLPGGAFIFLLYFLTQQLAGDLNAHSQRSEEGIDSLIQISTAICINEAGSDQEKQRRCLLLDRRRADRDGR